MSERPRGTADAGTAEALETEGIARFRLGQVKESIDLLKRAVRIDPSRASARIALGNAYHEDGQLDHAISSLRRAIRLAPLDPQGHNDLGAAYFAKGSLPEAITAFEEAVRLDPHSATALENLGSALRRAGRYGDARRALASSLKVRIAASVRRLFRLRPPAAVVPAAQDSRFAEAVRLFHAGQGEQAVRIAEEVLARDPKDPEALHLKGLWLLQQKKADDAAPLLEAAVTARPQVAEFHNSLGNARRAQGNPAEALAAYEKAVAAAPDFALAHSNAAAVLVEQESYEQAETAARNALRHEPQLLLAHINLSRALLGQGRFADAEASTRRGLEIDATNVPLLLTLGQIQRDQMQLDAALATMQRAVQIEPRAKDAHLTLGAFYQDCRRDLDRALHHFRVAQEIDPEEPGSFFNEGLVRLMRGEYSPASWDLYEYRRRNARRTVAYRKLPGEDWNGAPAPDKSLLVFGEQGIGDEIMFASMIPEAARNVRKLTLACDPRLEPLFARSFPGVRCIGWNRTPDVALAQSHDLVMPSGSLGRRLRASPQAFPDRPRYLMADPERVRHWRRTLEATGPGPYVGIAWRGGTFTSGRARRSLPIADLARALAPLGAHWSALQVRPEAAELDAARATFGRFFSEAPLDAVDDIAALIEALDAVVSVCCWVVHLAGALGKPVLVLAPFVAEWRYGSEGERMPWYPSARVLRQKAPGDWSAVLSEAAPALKRLLAQPSPVPERAQ